MRINFLGLQAFLSVANRGSFRRAAIHLHLSQTAISHRIKKLEEELGLKLFTRTTREVSLTQAGLELVERPGTSWRNSRRPWSNCASSERARSA